MRIRLQALLDLRMILLFMIAALLFVRSVVGPHWFELSQASTAGPAKHARLCPSGCPVCDESSPAAKAALDDFLIKTGSMDPGK
jgi:hypothetical protein